VMELLGVAYRPDNAGGASEATFVTAVIDRQLKQIKRYRARERRRAGYEAQSLDGGSGASEEVASPSSGADGLALRLDVKEAILGLTPAEQAICLALSQGQSQAEIARATGRSKAAICNEVRKLREKFQWWGLDEYLEKRPERLPTDDQQPCRGSSATSDRSASHARYSPCRSRSSSRRSHANRTG